MHMFCMTNDLQVYAAPVTKRTYIMGDQLEDKLYDLYDIFTQVQVLPKYQVILLSTRNWRHFSHDSDIKILMVAGA